ncbi:MAG: ribosome maturation factor RimP [Clostridia bacterium]|nr:ribosome maturation factor RimP [Clostridia bacterium]
MKTTEAVDSIVRKTVEDMGFSLCDVEFQKEYGNWVLTLFIDKPGGVTIDDCEAVSKAVDPVLDEADPIAQAYYLSVSSLGIDRPLKKDADYERNLGKEITVRLYAPLDGKKEITGVLQSYTEDSFELMCGKETLTVKRKDAALVKPYIRF